MATKTPLSKNAAIRESLAFVSLLGAGTSWTIVSPHSKPGGPTTASNASSYSQARRKYQRARAWVALTLMGQATEAAMEAIYNDDDGLDVRGLVNLGLRAALQAA